MHVSTLLISAFLALLHLINAIPYLRNEHGPRNEAYYYSLKDDYFIEGCGTPYNDL